MLKIRRLVVESEGIYRAAPGEDDILTYYANSIAHWMPEMTASYETTQNKKANRRISNDEGRRIESLAQRRRLRRVSRNLF
jgi:hypothetical protein